MERVPERFGRAGEVLRLSEEMESVLLIAPGKSLPLGAVVEHLHFRGLPVLVVLMCVPFIFPISIPGLSLPFGLAIALCGFRLGMGNGMWMPKYILQREVTPEFLEKTVRGAVWLYRQIERLVRPRWSFIQSWPGMDRFLGFMIMLGGVLLSLPIPPPFPLTNTLPAIAVIFIALGLMERDGLCILVGYVFTILALSYIILIFILGVAGMTGLWAWLTS